MAYRDLRDFLAQLEACGELKRISVPVDPNLEMTELCDRVLKAGGPALLFEHPKGEFHAPSGGPIPVLGNLFGTPQRVARAMGVDGDDWRGALREIGRLLAFLKEPEPPKSLKDAWQTTRPVFMKVLDMAPKVRGSGPCHDVVWEGADVDLSRLPVQTCWPGDAGPLITWGLTVTRGPHKKRQNLGIYRQQVIAPNKVILRWLGTRGGALDFRDHAHAHPGTPFPVAVALGADPATILGAVTPVPDSLSEYQFAGLLRGARTEIVRCLTHDLQVPATAEIVLEGFIRPDPADPTGYESAAEGPFGDHTGYYNDIERFPVLSIERITLRRDPIYHSTYTGKPPDEPAVLGVALNEVFVPLLQKQYPEISDFYLPPEGCSYRLAIVAMNKQYPGHAKRVMFGVWSFLRQFMYTKFILVTDADVDIRDWKEVVWALTTRVDPTRDTLLVESTPIDYLDFASPVAGLGSKMGIDATHKWPGETQREWGRPIAMDAAVKARVDALWEELGLGGRTSRTLQLTPPPDGPSTTARPRALTRPPRAVQAQQRGSDRQLAHQASHATDARQRQRDTDQRGGDRARRGTALGRRGRRDDASRGVPGEQRLHPLQIRLRDQSRLAFGEFLGAGHDGGGALAVREIAARSFSSSARVVAKGAGAACESSMRRQSNTAPATAKKIITPTIAASRYESQKYTITPVAANNSANSRQPMPASNSASWWPTRPRSSEYSRLASSNRVRMSPSSASARRASAPRSVPPPASRSGASLIGRSTRYRGSTAMLSGDSSAGRPRGRCRRRCRSPATGDHARSRPWRGPRPSRDRRLRLPFPAA